MLTTNVLLRCFLVRCSDSIGTCFTIDVDNRQYIVTAYHVVTSFDSQNCPLEIYNKHYFGGWQCLPIELVGHYIDPDRDEKDKDGVSVFAPKQQISVTFPLPPTAEGITCYDDLYILGFPYGASGGVSPKDAAKLHRGFPLPLAKKGILSAWYLEEGVMLLDAYNMKGFSGGPVIMKSDKHSKNGKDFVVVGVVSGYPFERAPVYLSIDDEEIEIPSVHFQENTGLTIAYSIDHAVKLIRQQPNPIGFDLSDV